MPAISELNASPYWDDFSPETKDYLRILFRPGYAVQARELNQLQSILQTQVERFGNHIFKEGSIVVGGMSTINVKTRKYVKIQDTFSSNEVDVESFLNKVITGGTSGARGVVVAIADREESDPKTLIIEPIEGIFDVNDETISAAGGGNCKSIASGTITGPSSTVSISDGIFYTKGFFVICNEQTAYLEKYSNTPNKKAGLLSQIAIIDEGDDTTLLDNATGSYNYAAPGAHRLKVNLTLASKDLNFTTDADKFIEILEVREGALYKQVTRPIYSEIEKTLARRTYDESGDYTVKPFLLDVQNHPTDNNKLRAYIESGKGYVKGYEFETIARQYVDLDKPRSNSDDELFNGFDIGMNYGNYVKVTVEEGYPNISSLETLYLYNAANNQIGTCRVSSIQYDSGSGASVQYRFYLFAIYLTAGAGFTDVRSLRSSEGSLKRFDLVAPTSGSTGVLYDTELSSYIFETGFQSVRTFRTEDPLSPGTFTAISDTDYQYKTLSTANSTTSFSWTVGTNETLQSGTDTTTKDTHYLVVDTLSGERIASSDYTLVITNANRTGTITLGATGASNLSAIYTVNTNTTEPRIKSKVLPKTNTGYAGSIGNSSTTIKLSSTADNTTTNYYQNALIKIISGTGEMTGATGFTIISYDATTQIATISGATGFLAVPDSSSYYEIAPPTTSYTYASDLAVGRVYSATSVGASEVPISLTVPDGIRIHRILNSTSQADWFDPTKDVTSKFIFDNGQRDFTYEYANVVLKSGQVVTGPIVIFFEYFTHTGSGYFNVDSYPSYDQIPVFYSSTGKFYDLKNCVDFRPVRQLTGSDPGSGPYETTKLPISGTNMNADITYWKPRIDKIVATTEREFKVLKGNADLSPKAPDDLDNGMTLYTIYYNPYTYNNKDIVLNYVENKRYTMRDIGRIEKRIENIEYYSLLNMLEIETATLDVTDANDNDRYKNGFIVDTFTGHGIGDVTSSDYRCAIDEKNQEARPRFYTKNYNLFLKTTESSGYVQRGPLLSRTFTPTNYITQPFASQSVNVNPYSVFSWRGTMSIDPSIDFWKDERFRPENIININGNRDNIAIGNDFSGSRWNNWQEEFNGAPEEDEETRFLRTNPGFGTSSRNPNGVPAATVNLDPINAMFDISDWRYEENIVNGVRTPQWRNWRTSSVVDAQIGQRTNPPVVPPSLRGDNSGRRVQNQQPVRNTVNTVSLGERVVDVTSTPWMRPQTITFAAKGLKPNTTVYPFFDDILISRYVNYVITKTGTGISGLNTITVNDNTNDVIIVGQSVSGTGIGSGAKVFSVNGRTVTLSVNNSGPVNGTITFTGSNVTNSSGSISGTFTIPQNMFLVGDRILRLSDNADNNKVLETTFAQARYTANGILIHKQTETINIRTPEPQVPVPQDPLAQTFFVDPTIFPNGLFIDSVDIFFQSSAPVGGVPVTVQIRPTVNGYPSATAVMPFAEKSLPPSSVNVSANAATATNFQFPAIVYLEPGEYSLVILANSTDYNVWIAEIGQKKIGTNDLISQQPYVGSLFKSQNSSTWTAEQTQDLKFTLKRCSFDVGTYTAVLSDYIVATPTTRVKTATGVNGEFTITVNNSEDIAIGQSVSGTGITAGAEVTRIDGFIITLSAANSATVTGNITFTGKSAGDGFSDVIWVGLSTMEFPTATTSSSFVSKPSGSSLESSYTTFLTNKNYNFSGRREIIANAESFKHRVIGTVTNNSVSPIIDMEKNNYLAIENDINNLYERTTDVSGATGHNATIINLDSSQYALNGNYIKIGSEYILVTAAGGVTGATGVTVVRGQLGTGATSVSNGTTVYSNSETFPSGGAAASKYITRRVTLQNPADYLKVYLTAVKQSGTDIKVYYKVKATEDSDLFSNRSWIEMQKEYPADNLNSTNINDFKEFIFRPDSTTNPQTISYVRNGVTYSSFDEFTIKIVFLSTDPTIIPRIADFRAIALDTVI